MGLMDGVYLIIICHHQQIYYVGGVRFFFRSWLQAWAQFWPRLGEWLCS